VHLIGSVKADKRGGGGGGRERATLSEAKKGGGERGYRLLYSSSQYAGRNGAGDWMFVSKIR
jgi:hypothetical protein